jgi:hypothetical protein
VAGVERGMAVAQLAMATDGGRHRALSPGDGGREGERGDGLGQH